MHSAASPTRSTHLSAHRPGRSLAAAVQARQRPLVEARTLLIESLRADTRTQDRFAGIFATRAPKQTTRIDTESSAERAAWALINMYLLAAAARVPVSDSIRSAEEWFLGGRGRCLDSLAECVDAATDRASAMLLSVVTIDSEFRTLLPYVLEPFDFAHRLSAKRCATLRELRAKKRTSGTFYTPGDVAATIIGHAVTRVLPGGRAIDPACGTGVFLLSLLREMRREGDLRSPLEICSESLYGIDISDLAVESCAFVLAHECLDQELERDPWVLWHTIRLNLWAQDATAISVAAGTFEAALAEREIAKGSLTTSANVALGFVEQKVITQRSLWDECSPGRIWEVFPEASRGFEAVVSNPPYIRGLAESGNVYIRFVELMLRVTNQERGLVGAVLPLSIAFASDHDTRNLRQQLTNGAGVCRFAFFDREPHGLFGEEVKTRSAILLRSFESGDGPTRVQTTPLLRLTSRTRGEVLRSLPAVELERSQIRNGVPKVGTPIEAEALRTLSMRPTLNGVLPFASTSFASCLADEHDSCVYIGPVAYNFINVARRLRAPSGSTLPPTRSSFLRCELPTCGDADAVFALFSSRIAYWLWNVDGDGFHVSRKFVDRISSFWSAVGSDVGFQLALRGQELWTAVSAAPIVSVNAGAWSIAFSPLRQQALVTKLDRLLALSLRLPPDFVEFLEDATVDRIVVSPNEHRRRQLVG